MISIDLRAHADPLMILHAPQVFCVQHSVSCEVLSHCVARVFHLLAQEEHFHFVYRRILQRFYSSPQLRTGNCAIM